MKWFWPCFFAFLIAILGLVAIARPDRFDAALVFIGLYLAIVAGLLALFGVLIGVVVIYGRWTRYQLASRRQQDGAFPLQRLRLRAGGTLIWDPNRAVGAAAVLHPQHGLLELEPAAGWMMQMQYNLAGEATRRVQAAFKGDDAHRDTHGAMSDNPRMGAGIKSILDPKPPPMLTGPMPDVQPPQAGPPRLDLASAVAQSDPQRLILGQAADGMLAIYNPQVHASAAIVGNTGTGKTSSVGYTLTIQAIRNRYHVMLFDQDGGDDWTPFASHAEYVETDRAAFAEQVDRLHEEFLRRAETPGQPLLVLIEEYGDLIRQLRTASRTDAEHVDGLLDTMMRRGRKRKIVFALIDQYPEHWSPQVISATRFRCVFQLGPNQGAKMEEYDAAKLAPRGEFLQNRVRYQSWDARPHLRTMLATLPAAPAPILDAVRSGRSWTVPQPVRPEVDIPSPPPTNGTNGASAMPVDDGGKWDDLVADWFSRHPQALVGKPAGISELARAMCRTDTGSDSDYERYKSVAHDYYHRFRSSVRLPDGQRLGIDPTHPPVE